MLLKILIAVVAIPTLLVVRVALARAAARPLPGRGGDPDCMAKNCGTCAGHLPDNASLTQETRR